MKWRCGCVSDEAAVEKKMEHPFLRFKSYIPKLFCVILISDRIIQTNLGPKIGVFLAA
jgi:hypothetical protein